MTKYYVDELGRYLGGFDGVEPPDGAIEVPGAPADAGQVWLDGAWGAAAIDIEELRAAKNGEINRWRDVANSSAFPFAGKEISVDDVSFKDLIGTAHYVALFGVFPDGFPGGWKTVDNTYVAMPDIDTFKEMFKAMVARGTDNFNHSQDLKATLEAAQTAEEIAAITW